jgi:hypothetical protein
MSDKPLILKTPQEHFTKATALSCQGALWSVRAKELSITNPTHAAVFKGLSQTAIQDVIFQIAQGVAAVALSQKLGLDLRFDDPRIQQMIDKHMPQDS